MMKKIFNVNLENRPALIAEIGVNHEGSVEKAFELISLAKEGGADAVKFQFFTPDRYVTMSQHDRFEQISKFSLNKSDFLSIKDYSIKESIPFFATPVTEDWVEIISKNCEVVKIASGDLTFRPTLKRSVELAKKIILSTGASNIEEIENTIKYIKRKRKNISNFLFLMHCISAYPTPKKEINLNSIKFLRDKFKINVGYSNHTKNIDVCFYSFLFGSKMIEVHFTDRDKNREFRDHALSFTKNELKELKEKINDNLHLLGNYEKKIQKSEMNNIHLIRKGIVASKNLEPNSIIKRADLKFARPSSFYGSDKINYLVGKKVKNFIPKNFLIKKKDLGN